MGWAKQVEIDLIEQKMRDIEARMEYVESAEESTQQDVDAKSQTNPPPWLFNKMMSHKWDDTFLQSFTTNIKKM